MRVPDWLDSVDTINLVEAGDFIVSVATAKPVYSFDCVESVDLVELVDLIVCVDFVDSFDLVYCVRSVDSVDFVEIPD